MPKVSVLVSSESATALMAEGRSVPIGIGASFGNDGIDVPFTVHQSKHVELIAIEPLDGSPR